MYSFYKVFITQPVSWLHSLPIFKVYVNKFFYIMTRFYIHTNIQQYFHRGFTSAIMQVSWEFKTRTPGMVVIFMYKYCFRECLSILLCSYAGAMWVFDQNGNSLFKEGSYFSMKKLSCASLTNLLFSLTL